MTARPPIRPLAAALALGLLVAGACPARAQDDLPKAEDILAKYVEATGGADAYKAVQSRKTSGTIEFVGPGLKGDLLVEQQAPNKVKVTLELENVGTIVQGSDGEAAYEVNPVTGARLLEGAEKANTLREADLYADLNWQDYYEKVETTGAEEVDGTRCYVVELTPKEGKPETRYFAADSGLLLKSKQVVESAQGEVPVESTYADYREVDGLKIPFKSTETLVGLEVRTVIESVEHGVDFPAGTFDLPEDLKGDGGSR